MANVRRRLGRLEQRCEARRPAAHLSVACVDAAGRVLDDGSEAVRPWVGRHHSELPNPVIVVGGIDPLRVLGLIQDGDDSATDQPEKFGVPQGTGGEP
jgi:hypothetical protein